MGLHQEIGGFHRPSWLKGRFNQPPFAHSPKNHLRNTWIPSFRRAVPADMTSSMHNHPSPSKELLATLENAQGSAPSTLPLSQLIIDAETLGRDVFRLGNPSRPGSAARGVYDRISRGQPMPPCMAIPGLKGKLWYLPAVIAWFESYAKLVRSGAAVLPAPATPEKRRRGRPTKLEQLARAQQ
jgi:hypothetical protein